MGTITIRLEKPKPFQGRVIPRWAVLGEDLATEEGNDKRVFYWEDGKRVYLNPEEVKKYTEE